MTLDTTRVRTFSWSDPASSLAATEGLGGLEVLQAIVAGDVPPPPIARLLGLELIAVAPGSAVFACEPQEWMYNPIGSVHGGVAATLLDSCMGCAVHTELDAGVGYTTTDLQVRYVRPMGTATGRVIAEGTVVHRGRRTATAEGRIVAERDGGLIAHATTGCALFSPAGER